jgi:polyphosphate kinase
MERNLDRRVEVRCRIDDPEIRARLRSVVELELSDTVRAWELGSDGSYRRRVPAPGAAPRGRAGAAAQGGLASM